MPRQQLLTRAYLGALRCYGNSTTAPYSDLYAATSDDIRRKVSELNAAF